MHMSGSHGWMCLSKQSTGSGEWPSHLRAAGWLSELAAAVVNYNLNPAVQSVLIHYLCNVGEVSGRPPGPDTHGIRHRPELSSSNSAFCVQPGAHRLCDLLGGEGHQGAGLHVPRPISTARINLLWPSYSQVRRQDFLSTCGGLGIQNHRISAVLSTIRQQRGIPDGAGMQVWSCLAADETDLRPSLYWDEDSEGLPQPHCYHDLTSHLPAGSVSDPKDCSTMVTTFQQGMRKLLRAAGTHYYEAAVAGFVDQMSAASAGVMGARTLAAKLKLDDKVAGKRHTRVPPGPPGSDSDQPTVRLSRKQQLAVQAAERELTACRDAERGHRPFNHVLLLLKRGSSECSWW
jgi:hypothetical protein